MKPLAILTVALTLSCSQAFPQYADQGSGNWTKQIWWLNWAGFTVQEGASQTFTTNDGLTIQVTFSNVTQHVPIPYIMDTWPGSLLYFLYNFLDPTILPALYDVNSNINFGYTLNIIATRNGLPVPFSVVTADAEASAFGETTTLQTNGGNWQTIEFYRNSTQTNDPLAGCGTQVAAITNTFAGASTVNPMPYGQNPIIMTQSPGTGALIVTTYSDHGGSTGGMGLAFGIFEPVDRGDLPVPGYGTAQHQLLYTPSNSCNFHPPYPTMNQVTNLHIGQVPGDADPIQYDNDDSIGVDEEGVTSFSTYDGSGSYSVNLTLVNTTGTNAYLTGWFDYNRDGTFEAGESVTVVIPNNANSAVLTWTGLPTYLPQGSAPGYGFRFRITSNNSISNNATGFAPDGEVEDYFVTSSNLCAPLSTTISPNQSICAGQSANLQTSGGTSYLWSPSIGLSDTSIANPIATPPASMTYIVTTSTPQGCSAQSSVNISVKPAPAITITGPVSVCTGNPDTLTATGGISYSWTTTSQQSLGSGPTLMTSPTDSTEYYVTGTGTNGCTATDSIVISVLPPPVLAASAASSLVCMNDTVTLTASGGDQYAWTSGSGSSLGNTPDIVVNPAANNDYQVQITNKGKLLSSDPNTDRARYSRRSSRYPNYQL